MITSEDTGRFCTGGLSDMANALIIVTCVRDVRSILFVPVEEAEAKANELLKERIANSGHLEEFELGVGRGVD